MLCIFYQYDFRRHYFFFHIKINRLYSLRVPRKKYKLILKRGFNLFFLYMIKILVSIRFISVDRLNFERYFRLTKI